MPSSRWTSFPATTTSHSEPHRGVDQPVYLGVGCAPFRRRFLQPLTVGQRDPQDLLKDLASRQVTTDCTQRFLAEVPERLQIVVLLGNEESYVEGCRALVARLHPRVRPINVVAYGDGRVTWVHTVHAKAQGSHLRDWLDRPASEGGQGKKREFAIRAIRSASN